MHLEDLTLALFAASNGLRLFAYIPQIRKAATDRNGASAISYTTWSLFLAANISTVAYALINRADWGLAACFGSNAVCCTAILLVTYCKCRRHAGARAIRRGGQATADLDKVSTMSLKFYDFPSRTAA